MPSPSTLDDRVQNESKDETTDNPKCNTQDKSDDKAQGQPNDKPLKKTDDQAQSQTKDKSTQTEHVDDSDAEARVKADEYAQCRCNVESQRECRCKLKLPSPYPKKRSTEDEAGNVEKRRRGGDTDVTQSCDQASSAAGYATKLSAARFVRSEIARQQPRPCVSAAHAAILTKRITKDWEEYAPRGGDVKKGLGNVRNDCFRNAVLQSLFHQPEVVSYLDGMMHKSECKLKVDRCIPCALVVISRRYWKEESSNPPKSPRGPVRTLTAFNDALIRGLATRHPKLHNEIVQKEQSDAAEFLSALIVELAEAERANRKDDVVSIWDIFGAKYQTLWTCDHCHQQHRGVEEQGLQVGIPLELNQTTKHSLLTEYLDGYFHEKLQIGCDSNQCKGLNFADKEDEEEAQTRIRHRTIVDIPEILVINLRRALFRKSKGGWNPYKESRHVHFEEFVDLGPYTPSRSPVLYRLTAVIAHNGDSIASGHYVATVKHENGGVWVKLNDDHPVETGSIALAQNIKPLSRTGRAPSKLAKFDPVVLFYSRMHTR